MISSVFLVVGSLISLCSADVAAADSSNVPVAAEIVAVDANATYFNFETVQLTNDSLSELNASTLALFGFSDEEASIDLTERSTSSCRVSPGDKLWPSTLVWSLFDLLLGKALIKTVPLASPCYNGQYYDAEKCADLTANWTNSSIQ